MTARAPAPYGHSLHALVAAADVDALAELTFRVARLGLTVSGAADRAEVWCAMHERPPDLVVLAASLALPQDGDLLRRLARVGTATRTPFVLVAGDPTSSCGEPVPAPAFGVLVYPCAWADLEATVWRAARDRTPTPSVSRAGPIALDGALDSVAVRGARVRVSSAELTLIRMLLQAPAGVSDAEINARLWSSGTPTRALVSLASRLRRKLLPLGVRLERAPALRGYRLRW